MRQFWKLHLDLLRNPDYRAFMMTPANVTFTMLIGRVYRPLKGEPLDPALIGFWRQGWLAAQVSLRQLEQAWGGQRGRSQIAADLRQLEAMGLIDSYPDPAGGPTLYQLGSWAEYAHPNGRGQRVEVFYVDTIFGEALEE